MAHDRDDQRRGGREPRARFGDDDRFPDRSNERGFFERAGDEVASWFGDDEAERRRAMDAHSDPFARPGEQSRYERSPRFRDEGYRRPYTGRSAERFEGDRGGSSRPMTGDYGRASRFDEARRFEETSRFDEDRPDRATRLGGMASAAGATAAHDRHYGEWRQRQIEALDRDYDDYRREHQSKFESDFSSWRDVRQSKRQMLGMIREDMPVVGSDEQPVGSVDRVAGDRIILAKGDPEAGGVHHSLMCTAIDRVEGDRVILDLPAEQAMTKWRDENRDRALFEREDQGSAGPGILNRSFSGTY